MPSLTEFASQLRPAAVPVQQRMAVFFLSGILACAAGLVGACGDAPDARRDVAESRGDSLVVIDWASREVSFHSPGWSVEFCDGEGPFLCIAHGDGPVGSVELLRLPVDRHSAIADVLRQGGSEHEALEAAAAEFLAGLSADRASGLTQDYHMRADPMVPAAVMGKRGLRLVVEGGIADRIYERVVHYYVIQRDTLYLITATGMEGGGSLGEFAIPDLRKFEPLFGEVAAASRVPPAGSPDG